MLFFRNLKFFQHLAFFKKSNSQNNTKCWNSDTQNFSETLNFLKNPKCQNFNTQHFSENSKSQPTQRKLKCIVSRAAKPGRVKPGRAGLSRTEPGRAGPSRAELGPSQGLAKINETILTKNDAFFRNLTLRIILSVGILTLRIFLRL